MCSWFYCPENVFIIKIPAVFRKAPESWNADQGLQEGNMIWSGSGKRNGPWNFRLWCYGNSTDFPLCLHSSPFQHRCINLYFCFQLMSAVCACWKDCMKPNCCECTILLVCVCVYIHIVTQIGCLKQQQSEWRRKVQKSKPNKIHSLKILQNMEFSHEKITAF